VGQSCPAEFPVGVTELRETVQFAYAGTGADVALSSDAAMGTSDGRSMHGDFWQTWAQPDFETFLQTCVVDLHAFVSSGCQP
jgi:hypothetical protein